MKPVTDLRAAPGEIGNPAADAAVQSADAAARAAGLTVRELGALEDLESVYRLYDAIWRPDPKNPPVTTELLRAMTKAGNYVAGAFDGPQLVGACVGFFGAPAHGSIHSHIAGVSAGMRGRSVGFTLKLHQRAWALLRGVSAISWTFDPLVCRNAYFNLVKLAATPVEYLPNFYGGMRDGINGTDDTDRLLVRWNLLAPPVVAACTGVARPGDAAAVRAAGGRPLLDVSATGAPVAAPAVDGGAGLIAVPPDIEALRLSDPGQAHRWRIALREALGSLLAGGGSVTGFDRAGWYLVRSAR